MRTTSSRRNICLHPGQNGRCTKIIENSQIGMSRYFGYVNQNTNGLNHGPVWKIQSFFLSETCTVILWQDCCGKGNFEKVLLENGWGKVPNWECLFVDRENGLFLSVHVDDVKMAGKKLNLDPMWTTLMKEVHLGEPTSFLDHGYLGCTQRKSKISKDVGDKYRDLFESRISSGGIENCLIQKRRSKHFILVL